MARLLRRHGLAACHYILLPHPDGAGWIQIDHLARLPDRILVIEIKNLDGRLADGAHDARWTQRFGRRCFPIQNPVHQNALHLRAVRAIVGRDVRLQGLVLLVGRAWVDERLPPGCCRPAGLIRLLRVAGRRDRFATTGSTAPTPPGTASPPPPPPACATAGVMPPWSTCSPAPGRVWPAPGSPSRRGRRWGSRWPAEQAAARGRSAQAAHRSQRGSARLRGVVATVGWGIGRQSAQQLERTGEVAWPFPRHDLVATPVDLHLAQMKPNSFGSRTAWLLPGLKTLAMAIVTPRGPRRIDPQNKY